MTDAHGIYIGPLVHLRGKMALLRLGTDGRVLAQFDDIQAVRDPTSLANRPNLILAMSLGFGWHEFAEEDFRFPGATCFAVQRADVFVCRWCGLTWSLDDPAPPACRYPPHGARTLRTTRRDVRHDGDDGVRAGTNRTTDGAIGQP